MWASMVAILLMALFQRFWRWLTVISRTKRLMMDVSSSVGEVVMLGAGSIEHRELIYYNRQLFTHPGLDPATTALQPGEL